MKWLTAGVLLFMPFTILGQTKNAPTLSESLQWLSGASETESGNGVENIHFDSDAKNRCFVVITETRAKASPGFWIKESFSLADIDPVDIQVEKLGVGQLKKILENQSSVTFHTTNYVKSIVHTSSDFPDTIPTSNYILGTNDWFAPRFAKALKRAAELCGAKPSSF